MNQQRIGVVGLGLMGRGIAACLVGHGHDVLACDTSDRARSVARKHIGEALAELTQRTNLPRSVLDTWTDHYTEVGSTNDLGPCDFTIESIIEDLEAKRRVYSELEQAVRPDVPIASNTSAIPITTIQTGAERPERFIGMHWGEPAHANRFLEIIRGDKTNDATARATMDLAQSVGKEPALVRKDIRGFIANRLCYAIFREACHMLDEGVADAEMIDRAFRNDIGWWATIAGPLRYMDLTGLKAYRRVMHDLLPQLSNRKDVPDVMQKLMDDGAEGITNGKGFYDYSPGEAERWDRTWREFTWDIRELADRYGVEE